jgi:hypothetical protein
MSEDLIYVVEVNYKTMMGNLPATMKTHEHVQGKDQRDAVMAALRDWGFAPSWSIYTAPGAGEVIQKFATSFAEFPPRITEGSL